METILRKSQATGDVTELPQVQRVKGIRIASSRLAPPGMFPAVGLTLTLSWSSRRIWGSVRATP